MHSATPIQWRTVYCKCTHKHMHALARITDTGTTRTRIKSYKKRTDDTAQNQAVAHTHAYTQRARTLAFMNAQAMTMTQGIVKQSSSITLTIDVYAKAFVSKKLPSTSAQARKKYFHHGTCKSTTTKQW